MPKKSQGAANSSLLNPLPSSAVADQNNIVEVPFGIAHDDFLAVCQEQADAGRSYLGRVRQDGKNTAVFQTNDVTRRLVARNDHRAIEEVKATMIMQGWRFAGLQDGGPFDRILIFINGSQQTRQTSATHVTANARPQIKQVTLVNHNRLTFLRTCEEQARQGYSYLGQLVDGLNIQVTFEDNATYRRILVDNNIILVRQTIAAMQSQGWRVLFEETQNTFDKVLTFENQPNR